MGLASQRNMLRFVKKNPSIIKALNGKDIFLPVIIAIGYAESGFKNSKNNFFGIANGGAGFATPEASFEFQANLFYKEPYKSNNVTKAKTPYEQARAIANSGYYVMDNDGSLGNYGAKYVGNATYNSRKQRWIKPDGSVLTFTKKQSYDKYYDTIKGFIDDALTAIPFGKVDNSNMASIIGNLNSQNV